MKLECKDLNLKLELSNKLTKQLCSEGMKHYPNEFGGLLVGMYSQDMKTCIIEDTILPEKYKSSKYYFERGSEGLFKRLQVYYNQEPKLIYVGEWHTHPNMLPEPSTTDKKAMREISEDEEVLINSPILIILGLFYDRMEIGAYVQFKNKLYKYE